MIKRFNVTTKKTYKKDGVDKTAWNNVGSLVAFEDGYALELSMFPETKFYIFDTEKKDSVTKTEQEDLAKHDAKKTVTRGVPLAEGVNYPTEDINPDDIPF